MAEHGGAARNQQPEQPIEAADTFAVAGPENHDRAQQLCLDFGRVLMLGGVLVNIPAAFGFDPTRGGGGGAAANITRAFIDFVLWILGTCMCLLALTPAAPWAVRVGAAVASNVLKCLSLL